jgi:hypothetical protein
MRSRRSSEFAAECRASEVSRGLEPVERRAVWLPHAGDYVLSQGPMILRYRSSQRCVCMNFSLKAEIFIVPQHSSRARLRAMPSFHHEALLQLFRNRPRLAPELLSEALQQPLPEFTEVRVESAQLSDIQPAEYRADLVILLLERRPVLGIVLEVQLARDDTKRYAWPAYVANLRTRIKCPVCLLVIAADEQVARWATTPIELGGDQRYQPYVLSPAAVPQVTDPAAAQADPELAVLSAMAHGPRADPQRSVQIAVAAIAASAGLDPDRATLYVDLVFHSLTEAARRALHAMNPANYEYQSEFARRYFFPGKAEGKAEGEAAGKAEGKAELLIRLAILRFGVLAEDVQVRIRATAAADLDQMGERLLTAATLEQVLGGPI